MVSELIATMTSVWPWLPRARYPHMSTIAVHGAMPSRIAPEMYERQSSTSVPSLTISVPGISPRNT